MARKPTVAVLSFPGNNGNVENLRCLRRCGMDAFVFRWNDSREVLGSVDGYFIGAGFSYEDRGRSGMVAARDSLFTFLHEEASRGKVIVGHCNGCQMLVESGLIPLGNGLRMCLAHNNVGGTSVGFLNEWIWITPVCKKNRCAVTDWEGAMHIPIAHGEGRFVTKDPELILALQANDQIAFGYCNELGNLSADAPITPNGSMMGIAGICNPAGNVIGMMPHAERTTNGDPYFHSLSRWLEQQSSVKPPASADGSAEKNPIRIQQQTNDEGTEIFIQTIIVNNEERTVEQAIKRFLPALQLTQYRYYRLPKHEPERVLASVARFNPHKEAAFVRQQKACWRYDSTLQKPQKHTDFLANAQVYVRFDEPDSGAIGLPEGSESGICYVFRNADKQAIEQSDILEILHNPHASTLRRLSVSCA